ncbi:oligosaccharide flippase family protein [Enterobacter sp. CC120223-11]|uniref:oligosaccharide flippase family protein n=1 Tax=Enterobacter sp. CC120223-11 TaxID=1378073 RepID=UPI000BCE8820|nr:oligosaccharide flippase family protein [Enterobacter sp. CC120223-11]SNY64171.1 Membrane protein involved in the export of O-antigen and teichoic acid [Enterobacter sp. CC120223-11]
MSRNKTFSDFLKYFSGDLVVKGFMFLSLPLLSRVMNPDDYGKMALINAAVMIVYVFISLNLQNAVINRYMKTSEHFDVYYSSVLIGMFFIQLFFIALCPFYAPYAAELLSISILDFYWVMAICILLSYIYSYTSYLQGARLSSEFVKLNIISKLSEVALIFVFALIIANDKYLSKIYAQLLVSCVVLLFVLFKIKKIISFKFDVRYFKVALTFSVPLILHVLSNSLLSQADRLIIAKLMGNYEAGIYSFAYNLGMCVIVIVMAWNSSWQPKFYALMNEGKSAQIRNAVKSSSIIIAVLSALVILFSREAVMLLANYNYYSGAKIVPIVVIANALVHIYLSYANFNFYKAKTFFISIGTLLAMLINIALNYCLIPKYGIQGAAWATVTSYLCLAIFQFVISKKSGNSIIDIRFLIYFIVFLMMIYLMTDFFDSLNLYLALIYKTFISIAMILLLIYTKTLNSLKMAI